MGSWTLFTSNRLDILLAQLNERLADDPLPPLQKELILVPGRGIGRYVELGIARHSGIAASLDLPFPGAWLESLCTDHETRARFDRSALLLRIFRLLGDPALAAELGAAAAYCRGDTDQQKRLQLATALQQCFDEYQLYRPDHLAAFARGERIDLPHADWQMRLFRELVRECPQPGAEQAAQRLDSVRRLLRDPARAARVLPPRLSVFGVASLPKAFAEILFALTPHVDVSIYAQKPTDQWYSDVKRDRSGNERLPGSGPVLLEAFGKQTRQFHDLLQDVAGDLDAEQMLAFHDAGTDSLLHTLQSDLLHLRDRRPDGDTPPLQLLPNDASLRVHSAHGPLREMEILRDQLLAAFAELPDLEPDQVLVLLPDVQAYAPYVEAAFAPVQHLLRVHIADRDPARELSLPSAFLQLFSLQRGRFTASSLLALLEENAIARRFRIAPSQLPSLRDFVDRTRIRWGLDGEQKARDLALPSEDANTWRQGLARLVLGVATGPLEDPVLGILPAADDTMGRTALLASFVAFVDTVTEVCADLAHERTLEEWAACIDRICGAMFLATEPREKEGLLHLAAAARHLRELAPVTKGTSDVTMSPTALRDWLAQELAEKGDSRGFLTGQVTVAALLPMRAVPMRVIAVCGLHDGSFPRTQQRHDFDLMQHAERRGDRNRREDDRQLFLDALLAAKDRLVLTYVGRSSKDNSECAPSTVLAELLDHVTSAFIHGEGPEFVRARVHVDHPLQSFSPRYGGSDERLFTFAAFAPERATKSSAKGKTAMREAKREPPTSHRIELDDLIAFWRHPQVAYCRRVLDVHFLVRDEPEDETEPFALTNLDRYQVLADAVRRRLRGMTGRGLGPAATATGVLPQGPIGRLVQRDLEATAIAFADRVAEGHGTGRARVKVRGANFSVHGELDGLRPDAMVLWRPGSFHSDHALAAFLRHVVLSCAASDGERVPVETRLLALDGVHRLAPLEQPHAVLQALVDGYVAGHETALPCPPRASFAFAQNLRDDGTYDEQVAFAAARAAYEASDEAPHLHDLPHPAVELCFRDRDPLEDPSFSAWVKLVHGPALRCVGKPGAS